MKVLDGRFPEYEAEEIEVSEKAVDKYIWVLGDPKDKRGFLVYYCFELDGKFVAGSPVWNSIFANDDDEAADVSFAFVLTNVFDSKDDFDAAITEVVESNACTCEYRVRPANVRISKKAFADWLIKSK